MTNLIDVSIKNLIFSDVNEPGKLEMLIVINVFFSQLDQQTQLLLLKEPVIANKIFRL